MTPKLEQAIAAVSVLPAERQDELADVLLSAALPVIDYSSPELEAAIDESLVEAGSDGYATSSEVEAVFAKHR
jgi:hypothetical protein